MSRSTDPGHFFQPRSAIIPYSDGNLIISSSALDNSARKAEKSKNTNGNPIKLTSKILSVIEDPESSDEDPAVIVAEAAGNVKRVSLQVCTKSNTSQTFPISVHDRKRKDQILTSPPQNGEITHTFRPNTFTPAPLSCLALSARTKSVDEGWSRTLFAGSWDKSIYCWIIQYSITDIQSSTCSHRYSGHADFVKALLTVSLNNKTILISASADSTVIIWSTATGTKLHTLNGHSRGVQALALDPLSLDSGAISFFSGDSNREIRRWVITPTSASEEPTATAELGLTNPPFQPLVMHETSIYALTFDTSGDLWTASADKTAKCLSRERNWEVDTVLPHPDFVKAIAVDDLGGYVVTGCRDEEVRIWDKGSGRLVRTYTGHYEEVTGLCIVGRTAVSVSIDGTIRRWSLKPEDIKKAIVESEQGAELKEDKPKESLLTEDEERELAELMDDSE